METKIIEIMSHYITPDNKLLGIDNTQAQLIPNDAVLIPDTYTMEQIPYIELVDGVVTYNQAKHEAEIKLVEDTKTIQENNKASAIAKLTTLGLTTDEIKALVSL